MATYMIGDRLMIGAPPPSDQDGRLTLTGDALRAAVKAAVNQLAFLRLRDTDWYVTRNTETGEAIPPAVTAARAAIRDRANALVAQVDAATDDDVVLAVDVTFSDL